MGKRVLDRSSRTDDAVRTICASLERIVHVERHASTETWILAKANAPQRTFLFTAHIDASSQIPHRPLPQLFEVSPTRTRNGSERQVRRIAPQHLEGCFNVRKGPSMHSKGQANLLMPRLFQCRRSAQITHRWMVRNPRRAAESLIRRAQYRCPPSGPDRSQSLLYLITRFSRSASEIIGFQSLEVLLELSLVSQQRVSVEKIVRTN